jgi:hypothetical protein
MQLLLNTLKQLINEEEIGRRVPRGPPGYELMPFFLFFFGGGVVIVFH